MRTTVCYNLHMRILAGGLTVLAIAVLAQASVASAPRCCSVFATMPSGLDTPRPAFDIVAPAYYAPDASGALVGPTWHGSNGSSGKTRIVLAASYIQTTDAEAAAKTVIPAGYAVLSTDHVLLEHVIGTKSLTVKAISIVARGATPANGANVVTAVGVKLSSRGSIVARIEAWAPKETGATIGPILRGGQPADRWNTEAVRQVVASLRVLRTFPFETVQTTVATSAGARATISGRITDVWNEPVPGLTVKLAHDQVTMTPGPPPTTKVTRSFVGESASVDPDGNYSITVPSSYTYPTVLLVVGFIPLVWQSGQCTLICRPLGVAVTLP